MSSSSPSHNYNLVEAESTEDLEKTLVLAAADADARNKEETSYETSINIREESEGSVETVGAQKRKTIDADEVESPKHFKTNAGVPIAKPSEGLASVVAGYYNSVEEKGLAERSRSRIVYLRNFHNWIKSMLINEYLTKIKSSKRHNEAVRVSDMCCGKGGDLLKWKKGGITHLICSDIASISLDQCKQRYNDMKGRAARERGGGNIFSIEYIHADCSKVRLREKYSDPSMKLDLVSCQFGFHYSFESLPQAECWIRNASECLRPGGFFIGTIPDSNDLVIRARKSDRNIFGNDVYEVVLDFDYAKPPLFGAKYNFYLEGVVDCPEFLVHFPTFVKLAKKYGLKLVSKEKFYDFYERVKEDGKYLLTGMSSLETYPPPNGTSLVGTASDDYVHAEEYFQKQKSGKLGTLSKSEWEASSVYLTFAFEKVKNTWNADGTPKFEI